MIGRWLDRRSVRWTTGVVLPIAMLLLDPAVFHSRMFGVGLPILGRVKPFCYVATFLAISAFAFWSRRPRPEPSAFVSGIFAGGAVFATALGCAILPFSLIGIILLGLGLLGLTPFLMAATYARAAKVAFPGDLPRHRRQAAFALGFLLMLGVPTAVQTEASRTLTVTLTQVASGDPVAATRGVERLRRWWPLLDLELLIAAYLAETDPARQARIADAYRQLTGQDAVTRATELSD
jgi:hypothetical protein